MAEQIKTNIFNIQSSTSEISNINSKIEDKDAFVSEIIPKLQAILANRFPNNPRKQKIKIYPDRINFAAPCCGDSVKDDSKKRGNIILSGPFQMTYKCHNCGTRLSVYQFFKKYGEELSLQAIEYFTNHKADSSTYSVIQDSSINYIYNIDEIDKYSIDREFFKANLGFEECSLNNSAHFYLINRKQFNFKKFLYNPKHQLLLLLNLTPTDRILGMQIAHLDKNYTGPKYKTYKLSNIYSKILKQEIEIPEEIDYLSTLFNITTINYNKPVTIVEGPMDSFLLKNCVATCGAGKHLKFDFRYRFLYDDDLTGRKHALQSLEEGYEVFMWDKLKSDLHLPQRKKWDVNDLFIWCSDNHIQVPNFEQYFSNDNLDLLDI